MLDEIAPLPDDPDELRAFTARLLAEVKAQAILIEKLRHQLAGHRASRFGASSETAEQLQLALETSEIAAAAMTARLRLPEVEEKGQPKRRPIPDHIPRMEVELSPAADACADCGGKLRRIGEDVTEELEYVPGRFIVNRIVRPRLTCSSCECFLQAPLPTRPIERGRPGPGLLAHVLVSKYADHLPLYRQSQIFERDGLDIDRSTLADWVGKSTALLEPLAAAIGRHVLAAEAIFADDTPVRMLAPGTGKTQTARLWVYARDERPWSGIAPPAAWYRFSGDRKGEHPKDHLARFRGWMHADGYAGFEDLYRSGAIREVACMAHVRRKFVDIHRSQASPIAEEAIQRIARLYAVEKEARGSPPERRVDLRQAQAAPVFEELEALARSAVAPNLRQVAPRERDPLCPDTDAADAPLSGQWRTRAGQQRRRARNARHRSRPEELSLRRLGGRGKGRRHCLHPDRNRQAQWRRSASLAGRHACSNPRLQDHQGRRTAPLALEPVAVRPDGYLWISPLRKETPRDPVLIRCREPPTHEPTSGMPVAQKVDP